MFDVSDSPARWPSPPTRPACRWPWRGRPVSICATSGGSRRAGGRGGPCAALLRAGAGRRREHGRLLRPPRAALVRAAGMIPELHAHSCFSFLDGASQPDELAAAGRRSSGYQALALTDHDGLCGSLEFAHAAREAGIRPITGAELTLAGGAHLTLLVETPAGYRNLCRLLTLAHAEDRRAPVGDARPAGRARRGAALPVRLRPRRAGGAARWRRAACARPRRAARRLRGIFGRERLAIELQRPYWRGDARRNRLLASWPSSFGCARWPPATSTPTRRAARFLQDALVADPPNTTLDACERERRGNREAVLRPPAETGRAVPRPRPCAAPSRWPTAAASTSPATSATATPTSPRRRAGQRGARRASAAPSSSAATPAHPPARGAASGWTRSWA